MPIGAEEKQENQLISYPIHRTNVARFFPTIRFLPVPERPILALQMNQNPVKELDVKDIRHIYGRHIIAECELDQLIDSKKLRFIIAKMSKLGGATVVHAMHGAMGNKYLSGVILAESHVMAVQTVYVNAQGENKVSLSLDGFSCGNKADPRFIILSIIKEINAKLIEMIDLQRDVLRNIPTTHEMPKKFKSYIPYPGTMFNMCMGVARFDAGGNLIFDQPSFSTQNVIEQNEKGHHSLAKHCIGQIYCSDPKITKNGHKIFNAILKACQITVNDLVFFKVHEFEPEGASVVVIHKDFYFTTHPWFQLAQNIAPADMYVNAESNIDPVECMKRFARELDSNSFSLHSFARGKSRIDGDYRPTYKF